MCCDTKNMTKYHGTSFKKSAVCFIAMILFVCIISVSIFSGLFIIIHANHEHDHDGPNESCAVCIHLATAENLLKQLSSAAIASVFAFALFSFISFFLKFSVPCVDSSTLISLKVRLNN